MKYFSYIAFFVVVACGSEAEPETISLEELAGPTGSEEMDTSDSATAAVIAPAAVHGFITGQLALYDTASNFVPHAMDRFGFSTRQKINFLAKTGIPVDEGAILVPVAGLHYYTFSDTTKTKNAFYNWLDCFGSNCNAVELNKDIENLDADPGLVLVYDTIIVAVEYRCEHKKHSWRPFQDSLVANFGKDYTYRVDVACNGPLKWKQGKTR
jgi:hypothetical protein